jgi:flagellar biosynthesis protein FliQ
MTDVMVVSLVRDAFYHVLLLCGPMLLASLVIGLIISIFQAATSISEQTLTFVPKLIAVFLVTVLILPFIIGNIKDYTLEIFNIIATMK